MKHSIISLPISIVYSLALIYICDLMIDNNIDYNSKFLLFLCIGYSFYAFSVSGILSHLKCGEILYYNSFYHSFEITIYVIITYLLVVNLSILKEPFNTIFPNKKNFYSKLFFITLTCIIVILNVILSNEKNYCPNTITEIKEKYEKLHKCLDQKETDELECRSILNQEDDNIEDTNEISPSSTTS